MSFVSFRRKIITKRENARDRTAISGQFKQFSHLLQCIVKIVKKLIKYLYMAEGSGDGNRYEQQNGEPNDIIRQLFSRIGELSHAISGRPNQVDRGTEVRRTFTGNGNANRERKQTKRTIYFKTS